MSKPSKQFRVLESDGSYSFISRHRAQACLKAGYADTVRTGVIQFKKGTGEPSSPHISRPKWGPEVTVIPGSFSDSGVSGFLRYPMPSGGSGIKFPTLSRLGAGL